jgi:hypothetical protein
VLRDEGLLQKTDDLLQKEKSRLLQGQSEGRMLLRKIMPNAEKVV